MSKTKQNTVKIVDQTNERLQEQLAFCKKQLFNLRFQKSLGELNNTSEFKVVRRNVARIKTELRIRKITGGGNNA